MNNSKTKPKTVIIFVMFILLSLVGGYLAGRFLGSIDTDAVSAAAKGMMPAMSIALPVFYVALNAVSFLLSVLYIRKSRSLAEKAGGNDELLTQAESFLSLPTFLGSVVIVLDMFLFSASAELSEKIPDAGWIMSAAVVMMVLGIIWCSTVVSICVTDVKKLNPEKEGSPLELNFRKKWEASCDEGQRLIMYKAAYKAFQIAHPVCLNMWLVAFICQLLFHTGILPTLFVCGIDLILIISYNIECSRLEAHGSSQSKK